jgi:hypothetical protein
MDGLFKILGGETSGQPPDLGTQVLADAAVRKVAVAKADIEELRQAIDKLLLITRALWEIIAASQGFSDDDLINKVDEIDLRDGVRDGKVRANIRTCASCRRVLPAGREKCIYCGSKNEGAAVFWDINTEPSDCLVQGIM